MKEIIAEEKLDEAIEDDMEEPLQPEKRGLELEDNANSDEELPEVFTMNQGKSMAQQLRSNERASERRIAAELRRKRQERAAARESKTPSETVGVIPLGLTEEARQDNSELEERSGLLDESIVQFLSKRERSEVERSEDSAPPKDQTNKALSSACTKRAKSTRELKNGRVQIVDLSQSISFVEERNAWEFKNGHLYGSRIRRDACMLRNHAGVP